MGSLERKLRRKDDKERAKYINDIKSEAKNIAEKVVDKAMARAYDEATEAATAAATAMVMAVAAEIIWNDWSKLQKKETRLQTYVNLMEEKLKLVNNPTKEQLEVEKLLAERCGIEIGRP